MKKEHEMNKYIVKLTHTRHLEVEVEALDKESARESIQIRLSWSGLMNAENEPEIKDVGNQCDFEITDIEENK